MGGALKVFGKSLKTVLVEVHFIVNLYSLTLQSSPSDKPFLSPGKSFASLPGRATSKTTLSSIHISNSLNMNLFHYSEAYLWKSA